MHLRSLTLKGFKSFPDRTRLEFGPGVSVVVGPNGSGKSNITDAVLWALGEQSPLAVRGQSMQDVIFGGARGQQARQYAEVELVLDNADGGLGVDWSEISILRRLDRTGDGEYRINGARCRLIDVVEALSDTGLGKEMHSVVSQGRVEAVVSSRPRDRRLLVEEAAGLGKHRKRRRRAQLKLERTQENLDRALDVEREARSRLRPLKRQAEAAELHERLERQSIEARWELARDVARARRAELAAAAFGIIAGVAGAMTLFPTPSSDLARSGYALAMIPPRPMIPPSPVRDSAPPTVLIAPRAPAGATERRGGGVKELPPAAPTRQTVEVVAQEAPPSVETPAQAVPAVTSDRGMVQASLPKQSRPVSSKKTRTVHSSVRRHTPDPRAAFATSPYGDGTRNVRRRAWGGGWSW